MTENIDIAFSDLVLYIFISTDWGQTSWRVQIIVALPILYTKNYENQVDYVKRSINERIP